MAALGLIFAGPEVGLHPELFRSRAMKTKLRAAVCSLTLLLAAVCPLLAQTSTPAVTLRGLRSTANQGSFKAARYAADGSLLLLYDGADGVRLLRTDAAGKSVIAEVREGGAGDVGIAMSLDPAGNIYVAGTSQSGTLQGTPAAAFQHPQDSSTNSFLAKFDSGLHLQFLTFLGASKTAITGVFATADAAFVTGTTFGSSFPTTAAAVIQQATAGTSANGFVERFAADGSALVYSTLLTGSDGDSECMGIVADVADHAYVVGETSAASFPSVKALVPVMPGATAGFVLELAAPGDAFAFSSFVPGTGLTGIDLDATSILLTGNVDIARFPIENVAGPIANTTYQSLLRLSLDGTQVLASTLLAPGTSSQVTAASDGTTWVAGSLSVPLFAPGSLGDTFFARVNAQARVDVTGRTGGTAVANGAFGTLVGSAGPPAPDALGTTVALPGSLAAMVNATTSLPRFDVPLAGAPTLLLPELPSALLPSACSGLSQCLGSAGSLTLLQTAGDGPGLSLSTGSFPVLTLRNDGSTAATGVAISAPGYGVSTDCTAMLGTLSQCGILLSGTSAATLTVTSNESGPLSISLPASSDDPRALLLSASELDFGIVTSSSPGSRTLTITNLSGSTQGFLSAGDGLASAPPYTLMEVASTCAGAPGSHTVPPNSPCTLTLRLAASGTAADDGPVHTSWQIAGQDLAITGITQAADLSVSSARTDFGTTFSSSATASLPRYLYLSNSSSFAFAHTPVPSPVSGPFSLLDECPSTLEPNSECRLTIRYTPVLAPSVDSMTLALDGGLNVLVTGVFLAGSPPAANLLPSPITAAPSAVAFMDAVTVTGVSPTSQAVTITNSGTTTATLTAEIAGDFILSNPCGPTLPAFASCQLTVQFTPSQAGIREGLLSIGTGSGSKALTVALSGTGAPLLPPGNGTLGLGSSPVGEPVFAWYKVSAALNALSADVTGAGFRAAIAEDNGTGHGSPPASAFAPHVTHSCRNCWLGIVMVSGSTGVQTGTLTLTTVAGGHPYQLALTGNGTAISGLIVSPSQANLGTVPIGSTSPQFVLTLANLLGSNAEVSISRITASGDFQVGVPADGELPCTGVLHATAACRIAVSFSPSALGVRNGTIVIQTTAGAVNVPLSGTGVSAPGLVVNPTAIAFDNVSASTGPDATSQSIRLTNNTGGPLTLSAMTSSSTSFTASSSCGVLQPLATCTATVTFQPGSSEASGSLSFTTVAGVGSEATPVPFSIPLSGTYTVADAGLVLLPADVDFGAGPVNSLGLVREFTLVNLSSVAQSITLSPPQSFPLAAPSPCKTLQPGESCTFSLGFLPGVGGALTGSVLATGTAAGGASTQAISYLLGYGNAVRTLAISGDVLSNGSVDFGQVASGAVVQHTLTFTNSGTGQLNLRRIATGPPFAVSTTCGAALAPGEQCQATLTYAPSYPTDPLNSSALPRIDAETLTIASDAISSPDQVELVGSALPVSAGGGEGPSSLASYTLSSGALTFANTVSGTSSPLQTIIVVNTGSLPLVFATLVSSPDFAVSSACSQLQPGASCSISVTFQPIDGGGSSARAATLAIQSNALDALEFVSLLGLSTPTPLSISITSLDFGSLPVGDTATLPVSLTNSTTLPVSIGAITTAGDYSFQPGSCPAPGNDLPAGETCTMLVEFAPTAAGTRPGLLSLTSDAATTPFSVVLTGVGTTPKLTASPGSLNFDDLQIGKRSVLALTVTDNGRAPLLGVGTSFSGPAALDYTVVTACSPANLAPGANCTLNVSFAPTAAGVRAATLTLASNDPSGSAAIPLTGTGIPAAGLSVTVNGESSTTLNVKEGATASFGFAVTPLGGFQGPVGLTCTPDSSSPYAVCSLLLQRMNLSEARGASTGTISTRGPVESRGAALGSLLFALPLLFCRRRATGKDASRIAALTLTLCVVLGSLAGCGGPGSTGSPLTPRGSYRYEVTATAVGTTPSSASATITLVVQ